MNIREITKNDIEALAIGAAILGSGGGGDSTVDACIAQRQLELYGPVPLRDIKDLTEDDLVVPLACMGAPLVGTEKLASGQEFSAILAQIEDYYGKKPTVLMTPEIGGGNSCAPFTIAGSVGLPVLDADSLGRAFPELQMSSFNLHNISASPAFLADAFGNVVTIHAHDAYRLERIARDITIAFGSNAHIGIYCMNGLEAQRSVVPYSISRALAIGRAVIYAQHENKDPVQAILSSISGVCIGLGVITDINQEVADGFLSGTVDIVHGSMRLQIYYKNENFLVYRNAIRIASTPDIIIPIDVQSGRAITTESLQYGLRVAVLVLDADPIWKTERGLALVGPEAFGSDFLYQPCKKDNYEI